MTEMVDKVAVQLLALVDDENPTADWPTGTSDSVKAYFRACAETAIEAMRQPTEAMEDDEDMAIAMHEELRKQGAFTIERYGTIALATHPFMKIVWNRMIDAALEPSE